MVRACPPLAAVLFALVFAVPAPAAPPEALAKKLDDIIERPDYKHASWGVLVVDDYAHHPTEIRATLAAARAAYPDRRLVAAFQPHLYTRTRDFSREFGEALALADVAMVADLYPAREQPIPGVTAALVARATETAGRDVAWEGPRGEMAEALARAVRSGDIVITLGAGDVTKTGPELLALLP